MTTIQRLVAVAVLAATATGCASPRTGFSVGFGEAARIRHGEDHFRKVCAACHGVDGRPGPNPAAPPVERIARRYSATGLARELEAVSEVGHYGMPVVRISAHDRRNLVAYLIHVKSADAAR